MGRSRCATCRATGARRGSSGWRWASGCCGKASARADTRYSWRRHLLGIATNLLGGAAIWTLGNGRDAAESTLIGIAVGEVQIWSQPWRAAGDLRDYEARFPDADQTAWSVRARGPGVELAWRF